MSGCVVVSNDPVEDVDDTDWSEWVPDLLEAIARGDLDPHLRAIVRTCFERKEPARVIPVDIMPPVPKPIGQVSPANSVLSMFAPAVFELDGLYYAKADVVGLTFSPEARYITAQQGVDWTGLRIQVIEVNRSFVLARVASPPARMSKRLREDYTNGIPRKFKKTILRPLVTRYR